MSKARPALILLICITGVIAISLLKYFYPDLVYLNSGLPLLLLLTVFLEKDVYTHIFCFLSVVVVMTSLYLNERALNTAVIQQVVSSATVIITSFMVLHIKKLYRAIEGEQIQMNALFEHATEGIILTNSQRKILLVNPKVKHLFQYEAHEMIGQQFEMFIPRRFFPGHNDTREEGHSSPSGNAAVQEKEIYVINKSGVKFPVEVSLTYYQQHSQQFLLAFITDITHRKESENKMVHQKFQLEKITRDIRLMNVDLEHKVVERTLILQEALHELERSQLQLSDALSKEKELNEIKSRFVSMASHEFRTPLSTILSSAALIPKYRSTEEQEKREKHVGRIKESVQHLNDLLEDFLNLGRLEEGRVLTRVSEFNVKEFLHTVFDEMKLNLKQGQQLKLFLEGEGQFVTDKRLLKNILINLLGNAIKFSDENKNIEITVQNSGHKMIMQIKDQGIGISKDDMPHLFSTFYRGTNATNIQGTGLGLHIVKRYIDLLKGHITLSSQLNEGTTFNIGLPNLREIM